MRLLPEGQHHTFQTGFNIDTPPAIRQAIVDLHRQASAAGMTVKPLELDWSELEPREGVYDLAEAIAALETYREQGWRPLVYLRAIDSDDLPVPAYLKGTEDTVALGEVDVSDPRFIDSYRRLLDVVVPLVRAHDGFAILVANEADNFLTPNPDLTGQVVTFIEAARAHVHAIDDGLAVGVALSNGFDYDDDTGGLRGPLPHHLAMIEASDLAVYNFYCLQVPPGEQPASVRDRLQARVDAAAGREIIIQELGCPSGADAGFSEAFQQGFFEAAYAAMADSPVRVSVAFQLLDWSDATIRYYGEALRPLFEAEPAFRDNPELLFVYLDQLGSIGLVRAEDGRPKPAWTTFLEAVARSAR